jgi:hypothetical protein
MNITTAAEYRDPSAWYHVVFMLDTTQAVEANRAKIWVNGEEPALKTATYPARNADGAGFYINSTRQQVIAHEDQRWRYEFDGYMAEFYMIDGTNLTASDFGKRNAYNQWVPLDSDDVKDAVTFGTNGFYLDFADSADLGDDDSGEGNDYALTNLGATDQMVDSPTNNYCTMNPINIGSVVGYQGYSQGNLRVINQVGNDSDGRITLGTHPIDTSFTGHGYYWEIYCVTSRRSAGSWGVANATNPWYSARGNWSAMYSAGFNNAGDFYRYYPSTNTFSTSTGQTQSGAMLMCAVKGDKIFWGMNGSWRGSQDPAAGTGNEATLVAGTYLPMVENYYAASNPPEDVVMNFGQDGTFSGFKTAGGNSDANGDGDFLYSVPAGYLTLCAKNLPVPEISDPTAHFNTKLYTGDGATTLAVTGVGFQPDFTWIKNRDQADDHTLVDSVRGATNYLVSNEVDAEVDDNTFVASLDADGFTVGDDVVVNTSTENYTSWNWLAGGTAASNTDGTITSSVSANTTAGFSIASYTGTGSAATIGHGLSSAPELIIVKNRDQADAWQVYCASNTAAPETDYLVLNTTAATADNVDRWNDTAPSASVFTIGDGVEVNTNTEDYIAYCFHSVEGYSKVGSYEGNGNVDGAFVYTGFMPAFVMTKKIGSGEWWMIDNKRETYNPREFGLQAHDTAAELTTSKPFDMVSTGFKTRAATSYFNDSATYIYIAFAESPFKTSNAQ